MDDTTAAPAATTTASASAAAVAADGATSASAAINIKNPTATNTNATTASGTSVKLLIKASNQQYDDQIIESDLLWTVRRLKTHLSMVYPSKPPVTEQKLIYSGQLLNDLMQLKDVIRSYKDVYTQNHIIHLVYIPKSMTTAKPTVKTTTTPATTQNNNMSGGGASTTDGLRQRHVSGNSMNGQSDIFAAQQQHYERQVMQFMHNNGMSPAAAAAATAATQPGTAAHMSPMQAAAYLQQMQHTTPAQIATAATCMPPATDLNALAANAIAAQQMAMYNAWMQQVYTQYMQQITGLNSTATAAGQSSSGEHLAAMQAYLQQQMPYMTYPNATTVIPTPNMISAFPNLLGVNHAAQMQATPNTALTDEQQQQQQQDQQQQQQEVQQRRFPNIVQDEAENRDWLDSFFSITRLAIFLTVLYFNTSPLRCFIVLIIGGAIYLYHIGVLRLRTERNNNNINRNNNADAAAAEQIRQGVQQVQAAQQQDQLPANNPPNAAAGADVLDGANAAAGEATTDPLLPPTSNESNNDTANDAVAAVEENASVISFIRTFVVTFFTSLLPETPAL